MIRRVLALAAALGLLAAAPAAQAADIFGGIYGHGLGTKQSQEGGVDIMLGARTERIDALWWLLKPSVHVIVSANTQVPTDFIAVGFNWPIAILHSPHWYLRPGIGIAGTTGEADVGSPYQAGISPQESQRRAYLARTRIDFGSHDLFEPEIALGYRINERYKIEASYVHLSNGQILHSGKNQGLDDVGVRLAYKFN